MPRIRVKFSLMAAVTVIALALLVTLSANAPSPSEAQQDAMRNCPQAGKWAISVWNGDDGTDTGQALSTCGEGAVDAAYYLHPQSQRWLRWFAGRPEISNLATLDNMQGIIALGGAGAVAPTSAPSSPQQGTIQNCPLKGKWAISVWSGSDGTAAGDALGTCGTNGIDAAYYLDPQTQGWLRWFRDRPDLSSLATLNDLQAVIALGGEGTTVAVTSTADSGPGTLRQALLDAQSGDTITFDTAVFPPGAPATIYLTSALPGIHQGNLTIDASNAGVILDGGNTAEDFARGLDVVSNGNTVRGLQVSNFSGVGIVLSGGAKYNTIGGDRGVGAGPFGQGNLSSGNDIGMALRGDGTSFNTIRGNLIGTDASGAGASGNGRAGIAINAGASYNTIGPDNVIAHNGEPGIEVLTPNSLGNTITHNSIHDNAWMGIKLHDGGNTELAAPFITDFDLDAGTIGGVTCANCTVETFSDSSDEGAVYEGQTTADGLGAFAFNKGSSFTGPHLTATATDADGNTSGFSPPTSGTSRSWVLQEGNNLPKTQLEHKQSKELLDNRMGDFTTLKNFDEAMAEWFVDWITKFGYKWVFLTIDWFDFTEVLESGEYSEFRITPEQDRVITDLVNNGIEVIYCLNYYEPVEVDVPFSWANLDAYLVKDPEEEGRFRTEAEIQRYLDYVRFIVHHFKDRVKYYQILNEPLNGIRGQYVRSEDYINLIRRVVPIIREERPDAKIVVGSVFGLPNAPGVANEPGSYEYLFEILRSDIMPLVDGISFHPSAELSPEYDSACYLGVPCEDIAEGYYEYYDQTIQEIKDVATSHGFKGEYVTEGPTFATRPLPPQTHYYSDIIAAKYTSRSIIMHLNENVITIPPIEGEIPFKKRAIQNLCNIMEAANPISLPIEIQSEATNTKSSSFALPNGDHLVAVWTDGVAVEDDPGVEATLTLSGFSAQEVTGIDVLHGFEQELITDTEGGDLVIRDLLVKDYPIILRFSDVTSS